MAYLQWDTVLGTILSTMDNPEMWGLVLLSGDNEETKDAGG